MTKQSGWFRTTNIYLYLLLKLLWAFLAILLTQVLFYLFNTRIFHVEDFGEWMGILWGNIRFGLATASAVMLPFLFLMLLPIRVRWSWWYRILSHLLLIVPMVVTLVANLCDCGYFQYTYRRLSSDIFAYLTIGGDMGNLVPLFLRDFWPLVLCGFILVVLYVLMTVQTRLEQRRQGVVHWSNDVVGSVVSLLVLFVLLRGGFNRHAIQLEDAARYCWMKNTALIDNSAYSILRTIGKDDISNVANMPAEEEQALYTPEFRTMNYHESDDSTFVPVVETGKKPNIVIIVLESFSQEYMKCYNDGADVSFTPFLDSLAQVSHKYNGRSNGKKSIEGIPAVFASLPTLMETPFIISDYKDNKIDALPAIIARNGYQTAFFHGGYNGSMNFDKFSVQAGFQHYYGKNEYEKKHGDAAYDHAWGIFDEPFFQYVAEEINTFKEPFMVGAFSLSSHHPYNIPEEYKGQFKQGRHPLLQCVMYSDYALRQFFASAAQQPWFKNTLFVITADHPGQGLTPQYNGYDGWYRIPMIFYAPGEDYTTIDDMGNIYHAPVIKGPHFPDNSQRIVQQIDVMPTVLDYLGLNERAVCFGTSIFQQPQAGWQVVYGNGYYSLICQDERQPDMIRTAGYAGPYTFGDPDDVNRLKAIVQSYSKRMHGDALTTQKK